ncbi:MAG: hypothetical protein HY782_22205 [Chloroflexi bacterium]|nr:hypothetical protein [Chloroflexota bacterium]
MSKSKLIASVFLIALLAACASPVVTPTAPAATPVLISPTGYRPVQTGDVIETLPISYEYVLPSLNDPKVVLAFNFNLLHFVSVKPELSNGLVAYIRDLPKGKQIYAFDENDPKQTQPKLVSWDATKPVEYVILPLPEGDSNWSVIETDQGEIQTAYKLVRRKDGGLRFIDAYGKSAIYSAGALGTINGTGVGLMLSARLALLRTILDDPKYQRGTDVMETNRPDLKQYDPRVLVLDPTKEGIAMNRDWVLFSRPGPNPGLAAP